MGHWQWAVSLNGRWWVRGYPAWTSCYLYKTCRGVVSITVVSVYKLTEINSTKQLLLLMFKYWVSLNTPELSNNFLSSWLIIWGLVVIVVSQASFWGNLGEVLGRPKFLTFRGKSRSWGSTTWWSHAYPQLTLLPSTRPPPLNRLRLKNTIVTGTVSNFRDSAWVKQEKNTIV